MTTKVDPFGKEYHERVAHATMNSLVPYFKDTRCAIGHAWAYIKAENGVESRSELSAEQWARIAARLNACKNHRTLRRDFIQKVKKYNQQETRP